MLEQHAYGFQVAVVARQHQERVALVIAQVGRQALFEQAAKHHRVPVACHIENLFGELRRFVVGHLLRVALI
ncbi:hypothetical protein D3C80_849610 [compost metagenome]